MSEKEIFCMGDVFLSLLPFHCGVEFVYERNSSDISRDSACPD